MIIPPCLNNALVGSNEVFVVASDEVIVDIASATSVISESSTLEVVLAIPEADVVILESSAVDTVVSITSNELVIDKCP